jgi:hypothetical protein
MASANITIVGKERHSKGKCPGAPSKLAPKCLCKGSLLLCWVASYRYEVDSVDENAAIKAAHYKNQLYVRLQVNREVEWIGSRGEVNGYDDYSFTEYHRVDPGARSTDVDCHSYDTQFQRFYRCALRSTNTLTTSLVRLVGANGEPLFWGGGTNVEVSQGRTIESPMTLSGVPDAEGRVVVKPLKSKLRTLRDAQELDPDHCRNWDQYIRCDGNGHPTHSLVQGEFEVRPGMMMLIPVGAQVGLGPATTDYQTELLDVRTPMRAADASGGCGRAPAVGEACRCGSGACDGETGVEPDDGLGVRSVQFMGALAPVDQRERAPSVGWSESSGLLGDGSESTAHDGLGGT